MADGLAVASVNYRLSQHASLPARLEGVKTAVSWLRAQAREYGLAPGRFGVWAASAGGHLAALLGTTDDVPEFDRGEPAGVSSRVPALCDRFGPTGFLQVNRFPGAMDPDVPDPPGSLLVGGPVQEHPHKGAPRPSPHLYERR